MKVEQQEAETIADSLDLTDVEFERITSMKRGNGLLIANSNHVFIEVKASKTEHDLITTDRKDLDTLARERKESQGFCDDGLKQIGERGENPQCFLPFPSHLPFQKENSLWNFFQRETAWNKS